MLPTPLFYRVSRQLAARKLIRLRIARTFVSTAASLRSSDDPWYGQI